MILLRSLRIGPRLALAFGALGPGLLIVAAVSVQHINALKRESRDIDATQVPALGLAGHVAQRSTLLGELTAQVVDGEPEAKAEIARVDAISGVATVAEMSSASAQEVSASTEQTSASAQEMASSAAELAITAERLDHLVSRFELAA